jgi:hypothetical protein
MSKNFRFLILPKRVSEERPCGPVAGFNPSCEDPSPRPWDSQFFPSGGRPKRYVVLAPPWRSCLTSDLYVQHTAYCIVEVTAARQYGSLRYCVDDRSGF